MNELFRIPSNQLGRSGCLINQRKSMNRVEFNKGIHIFYYHIKHKYIFITPTQINNKVNLNGQE